MVGVKIIGGEAEAVSRAMDMALGHDLSPAPAGVDILILMPGADAAADKCRILLSPDEPVTIPTAETAVCYGMSSRCTVTLSSTGSSPVLAIQRRLPLLDGGCLEPQEIPVKNPFRLSDYALMACCAALLILGASPGSLS